jgi:hypothetical protein
MRRRDDGRTGEEEERRGENTWIYTCEVLVT